MKPRTSALGLVVGGLGALGPGCSGRSIVIGGDPLESGGVTAGGAFSSGGVGVGTGGAFSSGGVGVSGTFPTGGATATGGSGVGGASGTSVAGGTMIPAGGTSSTVCGYGETGGESGAGAFDPYPCVAYEGGEGYRHSCPPYENAWGFTCWNHSNLESRSCSPNGDPYCDACSCAVPCESGDDCPPGITGHPADCIGSAMLVKSCFLVCTDLPCPTGMTCTRYPGLERDVCVWVSEPPFGQPPT